MIEFSEDQRVALDQLAEWKGSGSPDITLGGYAGTGKTTLISHLVKAWKGVSVCALAGKAANVLRGKGVGATTIHSLIYNLDDSSGKIEFVLKDSIDCETIIVDEASMVNNDLYRDLLSFRKPILFVGDHGQLEPIGDNPNLMKNPDIRLEKIHRQAEGNPILRLATAFREESDVPYWSSKDGRLRIVPRYQFRNLVKEVDQETQVICGFNATRHSVNELLRMRFGMRGVVSVGERVICLRNNRVYGIFNGQQGVVEEIIGEDDDIICLRIKTDEGIEVEVPCAIHQFGSNLDKDHRGHEVTLWDYAWCITAHKSQGSEFRKVLVMDEVAKSWEVRRWRYTVATRAVEYLDYCM